MYIDLTPKPSVEQIIEAVASMKSIHGIEIRSLLFFLPDAEKLVQKLIKLEKTQKLSFTWDSIDYISEENELFAPAFTIKDYRYFRPLWKQLMYLNSDVRK